MIEEPKLELKKVNKQLNRLSLVRARAEMRTKRRIAEQIENEQMKALEQELAKKDMEARRPVEDKKGK
jgi:hypothetical protein